MNDAGACFRCFGNHLSSSCSAMCSQCGRSHHDLLCTTTAQGGNQIPFTADMGSREVPLMTQGATLFSGSNSFRPASEFTSLYQLVHTYGSHTAMAHKGSPGKVNQQAAGNNPAMAHIGSTGEYQQLQQTSASSVAAASHQFLRVIPEDALPDGRPPLDGGEIKYHENLSCKRATIDNLSCKRATIEIRPARGQP